MEQLRDLRPEISSDKAVQAVASTIAQFMVHHSSTANSSDTQEKKTSTASTAAKQRLLAKIAATEEHLTPLLEAMALEGSYHMATPCHYCNEDDACDLECNEGSPWAAQIQARILNSVGVLGSNEETKNSVSPSTATVKDEFRESWWINPFADPPFYHPHVNVVASEGVTHRLEVGTVTEAVYEKQDYFLFDGGFFSNTALELRSKFNSIEAILQASGANHHDNDKQSNAAASSNICSKMNALTIEWAIEHAPAVVKKRYLERGIKLKAGQDIEHHSGPSWIWSHLNFGNKGECGEETEEVLETSLLPDDDYNDAEECRIIDSHTMQTPLDHPIPAAGGKLYCKLLSPARVLDWMYTDSLRGASMGSASKV